MKVLAGRKIDLARGVALGNCAETNEKYMSIETEREVLITRLNKALEVLNSKGQFSKGEINTAKNEFRQVSVRLENIKKKAKEQACLTQLILDRLRPAIKPDVWQEVVEEAKQDQKAILQNVSAW
jgi:hypothetical protein